MAVNGLETGVEAQVESLCFISVLPYNKLCQEVEERTGGHQAPHLCRRGSHSDTSKPCTLRHAACVKAGTECGDAAGSRWLSEV